MDLNDLTKKWVLEQRTLRERLNLDDCLDLDKIKYVAGIDISFATDPNIAYGAIVVLTYPDMKLAYETYEKVTIDQPYVSGFLAFREVPHLVTLFRRLEAERPDLRPDLIFVDGNGLLHPEKFGIACHLGVLLDIPTLGIAKSLMQVDGLTVKEVKDMVEKTCLTDDDVLPLIGNSGYLWGYAMPNNPGTRRPIYISGGHKVTAKTALTLAKKCSIYRIPEPIRLADLGSRDYIRRIEQ